MCQLRNKIGEILVWLGKAISCGEPDAVGFIFTVRYLDTNKILKGIHNMILTDLQKVKMSIAPVDAVGNPAKIDGVPQWASSDETLVSITPAADGLSCYATAVGPLGTVQVSVQADADLGPGVKTITGTLDIEVTASDATSLSVSTAVPEPK